MELVNKCERYFTPIGRIILGAFFLLAGISKAMDLAGTAGYIESVGLPAGMVLALVGTIIEVGAGGALLVGYQSRYAALVLSVYVLVITFPFHGPSLWAENPIQQVMFMKNIAIFGGLLFMAAHIGAPCCAAHKHTPGSNEPTPTPTL